MIVGHVIQLDPTQKQRDFFARACGVARYTWNWALSECERLYKETGKRPNVLDLNRQWNRVKPSWVFDSPRDANNRPFHNLEKAYGLFLRSKGKIGKPRLKRKHDGDSYYVANDRIKLNGFVVQLPRIGKVRLTESLRFAGRIIAAIVSRKADRWYLSVQVDVGEFKRERTGTEIVGVDLGLTTTVVLSTGEKQHAPRPTRVLGKQLARAQRIRDRRLFVVSGKNKVDSARKAKARVRVQRVFRKIANRRLDWTHKLTTRLCRENQTVVIEDLCIDAWKKQRRMAESVTDIHLGEIRKQLEHKAPVFGTTLVVADRWYPSSKTCSACGNIKQDQRLSDRTYNCDVCGLSMDRDVNAAVNLRTLGSRGSNARGPSAALGGSNREPRSVGEQAVESMQSTNGGILS